MKTKNGLKKLTETELTAVAGALAFEGAVGGFQRGPLGPPQAWHGPFILGSPNPRLHYL